jgi:hypothetical protein
MTIGILLIATGKYKQFVEPLIEGIKTHFMPGNVVGINLFTDDRDFNPEGIMQRFIIPAYKFPHATLYRFKMFVEQKDHLKAFDYLFYLDVDMKINDTIKEDILPDELLGVYHPGFFVNNRWGSENVGPESLAHVSQQYQSGYLAGGFQGGRTKEYLEAAELLAHRIQKDENRDIIAEHNDESHWNWLAKSGRYRFKCLTPAYCMVEDEERRRLWKISHLPVKIIALNKNHEEIRS